MNSNEAIVRILAGITLSGLYLGNLVSGETAFYAIWAAGVLVLSGGLAYCPFYAMFGHNTAAKTKVALS